MLKEVLQGDSVRPMLLLQTGLSACSDILLVERYPSLHCLYGERGEPGVGTRFPGVGLDSAWKDARLDGVTGDLDGTGDLTGELGG